MEGTDRTDRWRGALLGTALGDAVGAPFEGWPGVGRDEVHRWLQADDPLTWTDDTAMTLGLARSLAACGGEVDLQHLGDTFAEHFRAEPWRGYGAGPPQVFRAAERGTPYTEAAAGMFGGSGSFGNGAAMRAAPAAVVGAPDLEHVARLARRQALVTHAHPLGQDGAALQAMVVALVAADPPDLRAALDDLHGHLATDAFHHALDAALAVEHGTDPGEVARRLGNGIAAIEAVPAALACFLTAPTDPVAVLTTAVRLGGDTDTIAAMAGAIVGAHVGVTALPTDLLGRLEAHDELVDAADRLGALRAG